MPTIIDLTELKFGRLSVKRRSNQRNKYNVPLWECVCDCGNVVNVLTGNLKSGNTQSCGCLNRDNTIQRNKNNATHGLSRTPIYITWGGIVQRCINPTDQHFPDYGGRGISICDRWRNSFENFYSDMGPKPGPEYSIERRNNNGDYEPNNCYWATIDEQANNRRNNTILNYKGKNYTMSQLAREYNINTATFGYRLSAGWSVEDAVNTPLKGF